VSDWPMTVHQRKQAQPRPKKVRMDGLLANLLGSKSVLAVGLDPEMKTVHFYIKTGDQEQKWTKPLSPEHAFTLELLKGFMRGMGI
jgi:hypothetical protein